MKQLIKNNPMLTMFKLVFGGMLGAMAAQTVVILYTVVMVGIGYALLVQFNKKDTELWKDLQPMQYLGIVLCVLGLLPWGQYFLFGFLEGAGQKVFDGMFN